jgi:hypothetical protein
LLRGDCMFSFFAIEERDICSVTYSVVCNGCLLELLCQLCHDEWSVVLPNFDLKTNSAQKVLSFMLTVRHFSLLFKTLVF